MRTGREVRKDLEVAWTDEGEDVVCAANRPLREK
jgi:hypothetical protein